MNNYIAFFDLDNTILDTNSGRFFVEQAYSNGLLKKRDLARAFYLSLVYKMGLIEAEKIIIKMSLWLKDLPEKIIIDLAHQVFNTSIIEAIRKAARDEIDYHKKKEGKTVLLSAATNYICSLVREFIPMDDMICTEMEVVNGHFTGLPRGNYCYGVEKLHRLREYCLANQCTLNDVYYYADSFSDLPVLEAVGRPVCVTPEPALLAVAREKGWPIHQW